MAGPLCGAKKKESRGGGTCRRPAGWGTDHPGYGACKMHGGRMQTHQIAAERQMAAEAVAKYGLPREIDPQTALLEEVWRCAGNVAFLHSLVGNLEYDEDAPNRQAGGGSDILQFDHQGDIVVSHWVKLYHTERAMLVKVSAEAIKCGVAERQVKLAEQQGALVADAFRKLFDDPELGLTPAQKAAAPAAARRALTVVAA